MKIKPRDIARSLIDSMEANPSMSADEACLSAITLLKRTNPGMPFRQFVKILERELKKKGPITSGLLVVPSEKSVTAESIGSLLKEKSGTAIAMDRAIDPDLIGGAVLLVDHRRIDCSVQGALDMLLKMCLQPLD